MVRRSFEEFIKKKRVAIIDRSCDKLASSLVDLHKILKRFEGDSKVRSHEIWSMGSIFFKL